MIIDRDFIKPEDIEINEETYRISCIPPIEAAEILPSVIDAIKRNDLLGQIMLPTDIMLKIIRWSAKKISDGYLPLDSQKAINSNVSYASLLELQVRIIKKNFDFLTDGGLQKILGLPPTSASKQ